MFSDASFQPTLLSLDALVKALADCSPRLVGDGSTLVSAITEDSRRVTPGSLFVARRGQRADGTLFVSQALEAGAVGVLCAHGAEVDVTPRIEVGDVGRAWGICAQRLAGDPSRDLITVGITGTNGKTTVACLIEQALSRLGRRVARLGTLGFFIGDERLDDSLTTPQPDQLAAHFREAKARGAEAMVLEVSSHALDQGRVAGVHFDVAVFTNLSQDHLDYHANMAEYAGAKARLFREGAPAASVFNIDDALGRSLAEEVRPSLSVSARGDHADLEVLESEFSRSGLRAKVRVRGEVVELQSVLLGRHNLENLLVSWGALDRLGFSPHDAATALSASTGVPGRLERCDGAGDDIVVVVDYAHTPDALERALSTLDDLGFEELVCVFGCGGDRDKKKRPLMGNAAAQYADRIFVTSDNPRSEDPAAILQDILPGLAEARRPPEIEVDRKKAIFGAISAARPGAVVLVAGKGHEDYQLVGDQVRHFDDREVAREALSVRRSRAETP